MSDQTSQDSRIDARSIVRDMVNPWKQRTTLLTFLAFRFRRFNCSSLC
jgi:hypothetical protein